MEDRNSGFVPQLSLNNFPILDILKILQLYQLINCLYTITLDAYATGPTFKKSLVPYLSGGGTENKYLTLYYLLLQNIWLITKFAKNKCQKVFWYFKTNFASSIEYPFGKHQSHHSSFTSFLCLYRIAQPCKVPIFLR